MKTFAEFVDENNEYYMLRLYLRGQNLNGDFEDFFGDTEYEVLANTEKGRAWELFYCDDGGCEVIRTSKSLR